MMGFCFICFCVECKTLFKIIFRNVNIVLTCYLYDRLQSLCNTIPSLQNLPVNEDRPSTLDILDAAIAYVHHLSHEQQSLQAASDERTSKLIEGPSNFDNDPLPACHESFALGAETQLHCKAMKEYLAELTQLCAELEIEAKQLFQPEECT